MLKRAFSVVVCLFLWTPGYAQTLGTITGEVKDATGAALPGATVTAQNVGTNAVRIQQSNEVGAYTFPAMPPGAYLIKAELDGFRIAQNRVELHVEETLRVSLTLEIGGITETTEVTASRRSSQRKMRRSAPSSRTGASSSCRSTVATT